MKYTDCSVIFNDKVIAGTGFDAYDFNDCVRLYNKLRRSDPIITKERIKEKDSLMLIVVYKRGCLSIYFWRQGE